MTAERQPHIVVVGSLNMDLVVRTPRHPQIGETIIGSDFQTFPGGKGANQAVAAARLGSQVKMIGRVGDDAFGVDLLASLQNNAVDTTYILQDEGVPTGVAFITVDEQGKNTIVVASGANAHLEPNDVLAAEDAFVGAGVLLLQLECPLAVVERAVKLARKHGVQVVLNPAPAQVLDSELLASVDYLLPNQTELALLAGQDTIATAIEMLLQNDVKRIVVTLGEQGALLVDGEQQEQIPTFEVNAVDTTAAGDAFAGAFAVALLEGRTLREAVVWGNAAGAITVTRAGAQPSLPNREEFDHFLSERQPDARG